MKLLSSLREASTQRGNQMLMSLRGVSRRRGNLLQGNILPLALIITFTIVLAGVGIGTVVLEGSGRAREIDDSVAAYYMADSGIERELFELRKHEATLPDVTALSSQYPTAGTWSSTAAIERTDQKTFDTIPQGDFHVIDLFDPNNLGSAGGVDQLQINWAGAGLLEIGYAQWLSGSIVTWPSEDSYVLETGEGPSYTVAGLDANKAYRFRIKAMNGDATNVAVTAFHNGSPVPFPGDVTLSAEGTYGKATQKTAVTLPKLDSLLDIYGFVLLSE